MENNPEGNGWPEYRREVMSAIRDLKQDVKELRAKVDGIGSDVTGLKLKAGAWGFVAGGIPAAIATIWYLVSGRGR